MVASVSERGYPATRLEDLVELSGVSSASFYRLFPSKNACFLAASEEMLRGVLVATEITEEGSWEDRARGALASFAHLVSTQQSAARMLLIDSFAAGPEAAAAVDATVEELRRRAVGLMRESPERAGMPDEVPMAIVGAVQELACDRLRRGRADTIPHLMGRVAEVAFGYRPPSTPLRYTSRLPRPRPEELDVPGSAERAIRALAVVAAERGYRQVTVEEMVRTASMSPTTFYNEFADKHEAMLAAIDGAGAQMAAAALPGFRRNSDWPAALRTGLTDLLTYLASRPALARLVFIEAYAAGPWAIRRRAEALRPLGVLLAAGSGHGRTPPAGAQEVIWAMILAMIQRQIRASGAQTLPALGPALTFIALGPYLGAEEASASAVGRRRDRADQLDHIRSVYLNKRGDRLQAALNLRPSTPEELAARLGMELEEVGRTLAKMIEAGVVRSLDGRTKEDPIDGRYEYLLEGGVMTDVTSVSVAGRNSLVKMIIESLHDELRESIEADLAALRPEYVTARVPLIVDEKGWHQASGILDETLTALISIVEESRARIETTGEPPILATTGLLLFEVPGDPTDAGGDPPER